MNITHSINTMNSFSLVSVVAFCCCCLFQTVSAEIVSSRQENRAESPPINVTRPFNSINRFQFCAKTARPEITPRIGSTASLHSKSNEIADSNIHKNNKTTESEMLDSPGGDLPNRRQTPAIPTVQSFVFCFVFFFASKMCCETEEERDVRVSIQIIKNKNLRRRRRRRRRKWLEAVVTPSAGE